MFENGWQDVPTRSYPFIPGQRPLKAVRVIRVDL